MLKENLLEEIKISYFNDINEKFKILPCLQSISISSLYMYPQLALYIQNQDIAFINDLASYAEKELMAKLNINKDVCGYIYSKIDQYCMNSGTSRLICPNMPRPCISVDITILRLSSDIIKTLKEKNIYTLGDLAVFESQKAKTHIKISDAVLNEIKKASQLVVDDFRRGLLFTEKHDENSEKESNIILNTDSVKVEKVLKNKTLEALYVPRLNVNMEYWGKRETIPKKMEETNNLDNSLFKLEDEIIKVPSAELLKNDRKERNNNIEPEPNERLKAYLDEEKRTQQELQLEDVFNLEKIIEFMSKRPIITEDERKYLSWEEIAHKLTFFWDVPLKELNISADNFIGINTENVKTIGDILSLILENNLNWLKCSNLHSGTISPSALKITPILLQAKEYREKITQKEEPANNTRAKILNKISIFLKNIKIPSYLKS